MDSTISHTSPCVSVKSTITIYISGVCPRLGVKKTGYEKKGGSTFEGMFYVIIHLLVRVLIVFCITCG